MMVLFDTDVLIAGMIEKHKHHKAAFSWLNKAAKKEIEGIISQHTIAELYAVLTAFPIRPRISPDTALRLIKKNLKSFRIVEMSKDDYFKLLELMAGHLCVGVPIYDGIIGYITTPLCSLASRPSADSSSHSAGCLSESAFPSVMVAPRL